MFFTRGLKSILAVALTNAIVGLAPELASAQSIPFQQTKGANCFTNFNDTCEVSFAVPTGERREINTVSCAATIGTNSAPIAQAYLVAFSQTNTPLALHNLVPFRNGTTAGVSYNTMNHQLLLFAPGGGKFVAHVTTNGATNMQLTCSISGQRIK